jgi:K+-sensing histidine kinase KdpD
MKGSPQEASGRSIAYFLLACIVLAFVTLVCVRFHTRLAIVALLYLLIIVVISFQCRFSVTLLCSVLAFLGLDYFFTEPVFSLAVTRPEDIAALSTFSTIALIVTVLGSKVRKSYWELAQEGPRELLITSEKVTAPEKSDHLTPIRRYADTPARPDTAHEDAGPNLAEPESVHILVSVADAGTGLSLNDLDQMFDAFYTTKPQGLGMGLSISRSIVKAHGGRLWAMTNVPKGALFQFTLPVAVSSERQAVYYERFR